MADEKKNEQSKEKGHPPAPAGAMGHVNGDDGQPVPLSYPPKFKKGTPAHAQALQMSENWDNQKLPRCSDPKCYYPLRERRDSATHEVVKESTAQGEMIVGECSWDPRHGGGKQLFKAPKRNNLDSEVKDTVSE